MWVYWCQDNCVLMIILGERLPNAHWSYHMLQNCMKAGANIGGVHRFDWKYLNRLTNLMANSYRAQYQNINWHHKNFCKYNFHNDYVIMIFLLWKFGAIRYQHGQVVHTIVKSFLVLPTQRSWGNTTSWGGSSCGPTSRKLCLVQKCLPLTQQIKLSLKYKIKLSINSLHNIFLCT